MKRIAISFALLFFAISVRAQSAPQDLKAPTEKVLVLLKTANGQGESTQDELRELVRTEMETRFEWEATSRTCLGRHWAERTPAEQTEFVKVFSEFLKGRYSDLIAEYYRRVKRVDYKGQQIIDNHWASVKLVVTTKAKVEHSIEYCMGKAPTSDEWKINDVVIDGDSLVKTYSDRLDAIITTSSYETLVKEMKSKLLLSAALQPSCKN